MNISGKYVIKGKDVIHKEIESRSVLLNLDNGNYYTLNETGTFIWSLIDGKNDIQHIIGRLVERFAVERDEASGDVETLVTDLMKENLIELHDEPE